MIAAVQHVVRRDRCWRALYFAALPKGAAVFSRTSSFDTTSPNGTVAANVLYEMPVAILTFSQLTRPPGDALIAFGLVTLDCRHDVSVNK
jgi:hypothetical protein